MILPDFHEIDEDSRRELLTEFGGDAIAVLVLLRRACADAARSYPALQSKPSKMSEASKFFRQSVAAL